jgi:hypothetical protein
MDFHSRKFKGISIGDTGPRQIVRGKAAGFAAQLSVTYLLSLRDVRRLIGCS